MPMGDFTIIPRVMMWMADIQPKKVLDIGCGFGLWGMLTKQYAGFNFDPEKVRKWAKEGKMDVEVHGLEIYPDYIKVLQEQIYDEIILMNALEYAKKTKEKYDCVLLMDVIEHLKKEDGYELLDVLLKKVTDNVLISTPYGAMVWRLWDKDYAREEHISAWSLEDFKKKYNVIDDDIVDQRLHHRKQLLVRLEYSLDEVDKIIKDTIEYQEEKECAG